MRSVQANVASVMCSYNQVNGTYACENSHTLNHNLKRELGFNGYVVSDWFGQHSGARSAMAGLDMTMPGEMSAPDNLDPTAAPTTSGSYEQLVSFWGKNLTHEIHNGSLARARLDDMAARVLTSWYLLGQDDDYPEPNYSSVDAANATSQKQVNAMSHDHSNIAREVAAAGTVLLKNERGALPLRRPKKLALIGSGAAPAHNGANYYPLRMGLDGVLGIGGGSGAGDFAYLVSPYEAIAQYVDFPPYVSDRWELTYLPIQQASVSGSNGFVLDVQRF